MTRNQRRAAAARGLFRLIVLLLLLAGCEPPNERPPDALLQDSLGLGEDDQVWRVRLGARENREHVDPAEVSIPPGAYVEFITTDRRVHTVIFPEDSLSGPAAAFLRSTNQTGSPPLVERDARFVMSFEDAPPGRYPFRVEGNGDSAAGAVVVEEEER